MTVKELKRALDFFDDNLEVLMLSDPDFGVLDPVRQVIAEKYEIQQSVDDYSEAEFVVLSSVIPSENR